MTADADRPLRAELSAIRDGVEGVIREMGVEHAEWADPLPQRIRNVVEALQTEIDHWRKRAAEQMTKRQAADAQTRKLVAEMDAQVGAEHRANRAVQLVPGGIIAPSEVRPWNDGETDAQPSTA